MYRFFIILLITIFGSALAVRADGLLLPESEDYPKDFLQNRWTEVTVNIHDLVAETIVYQEFVNEWHHAVDAVYAFPLPADARATLFLYWRNDTTFKAVLKVREQVTNPGTGEGGIVALVNEYIGRNGIKVALKGIAPGAIQRVQLHYLSFCDYFKGETRYRFPLDTGEFIKYPLEHLQFNFNVDSNSPITGFKIPTHPDYSTIESGANRLRVEVKKPKAYVDTDLEFCYTTDHQQLGVDFFSVANDSMPGHFALFVRPPDAANPEQVLSKRMVFLISNSSRMAGYPLDQSLASVAQAVTLLQATDYFNIIVFNQTVNKWQSQMVQASSQNIAAAEAYLTGLNSQYGSRLDLGLAAALEQFPDDALSNAVLVFSDGRATADPRQIANLNVKKAGIFTIGVGEDIDRARLELISALNYGFVTYFSPTDDLRAGMMRVFEQISHPIMKDNALEFGRAEVYDVLPPTLPTTFAGSYFFMTGRYRNAGVSALAVAGNSVSGTTAYDFRLDFSAQTQQPKFAEQIWAREAIDYLEREVEIYGETQALKDSLIALSLRYNIRCRYTSYIADYESVFTRVGGASGSQMAVPVSYLIGNYPNPFNPETQIQFYLSEIATKAQVKLIRIYNALGQLVAIIDISQFGPGFHAVRFDGRDFWGQALPSGVYFVRLEAGPEVSTLRILLMK